MLSFSILSTGLLVNVWKVVRAFALMKGHSGAADKASEQVRGGGWRGAEGDGGGLEECGSV